MATDAPMATHTDIDLLTLTQWMSPAFPVGAYSYSHGLEAAVQCGTVHDGVSLGDWVETVMQYGSGTSDALFLAAAYRAGTPARLWDVDGIARAFAPSKERLLETTQQGVAFCKTVTDVWGLDTFDLTYPVAVGRAARSRGLPQTMVAQFYLHAILSNLVGAGMRMSVVGQTAGQKLIRDLSRLCIEIAEETKRGDVDDLSGTAFLADIASMKHETQYSRIFRT